MSLKEFIPLWKPPSLPARISVVMGGYAEYLGNPVRIDRNQLIKILEENGYTVIEGLIHKKSV